MKKTTVMTKILVAVMAAAMMVGTAAGCQGSRTAGQDAAASTESSVVAVPESQPSSVVASLDSDPSASKYIDLKTVSADKFELILTGKDNDKGQYEELFVLVDDGSANGYAAIYITEETDGKKTSGGVLQGSVTEKKETDNEDGTRSIAFTVRDERGMSGDMVLTGKVDGEDFTMTFSDVPYVMQLKKVETAKGMEMIDEQLKILEENDPTANAYLDSDAATMDSVCKSYYAEVIAGVLNDADAANVKADTLPKADATEEERKAAADKCTIQGALEYAGLENIGMQDKLSEMAADETGTIYSKKNTSVQADRAISADTTLGELYPAVGDVIDDADDMAKDASDAASIDAACKNYLAAVESGALDEEAAKNVTADTLPVADATPEERQAAVLKCTIKGALEYCGMADIAFDFSKFAVDENGTIFSKNRSTYGSMLETITENTTFGEIYDAVMGQVSDVSDKAADASDAALIDNSCKIYYAAVVSGAIYEDEFAAEVKADTLPDTNATEEERIAAALKCTIQGALEYNGVADVAFDLSKFAADAEGSIFAKFEDKTAALETITADTTFEMLGYGNTAAAE